jgi:hypothetical protein
MVKFLVTAECAILAMILGWFLGTGLAENLAAGLVVLGIAALVLTVTAVYHTPEEIRAVRDKNDA